MLPMGILAIESESDRTYITEIYQQHRHLMYSIIRKTIQNAQDVEDIINEVMLSLIRNIATIRELNEFSLRKYVLSATKTATINYLVRRTKTSQFEFVPHDDMLDAMPASGDHGVDGVLIQLEEIQQLKDALKALPQYEFDILFMREYDGLADSQIASIIGKKENSVRSYASRAYKHAREILAKYRGEQYDQSE